MPQLKISNLSKTYPNGTKALQDVSLELESGLFGLLGPNGAGKSTLMRILASLQECDEGTATLDNIDILHQPKELRKHLGYLPQEFGVYPRISARDLLNHLAVLKGISNRKERQQLVNVLLQKVNLYDERNKSVKGFSGGMKQRFGIAQALIGNPKLIIVDEPTAGLDPGERNRFHNILAEMSREVIIMFSTHIVDDVRELCSNMAILNKGNIVYKGAPKDALTELEGQVWEKHIKHDELAEHQEAYKVISDKMIAGNPVIHILSDSDPGHGFSSVTPTLEDVFFDKTGQPQIEKEPII